MLPRTLGSKLLTAEMSIFCMFKCCVEYRYRPIYIFQSKSDTIVLFSFFCLLIGVNTETHESVPFWVGPAARIISSRNISNFVQNQFSIQNISNYAAITILANKILQFSNLRFKCLGVLARRDG